MRVKGENRMKSMKQAAVALGVALGLVFAQAGAAVAQETVLLHCTGHEPEAPGRMVAFNFQFERGGAWFIDVDGERIERTAVIAPGTDDVYEERWFYDPPEDVAHYTFFVDSMEMRADLDTGEVLRRYSCFPITNPFRQ
jgi:hypothetical protein